MLLDRVLAPVGQIPHSPVLVAADRPVSYRQLRALLARAVALLRQQGIREGDVVGLALSQTPVHLVAWLALGWIGALSVPVAPSLRPEQRAEVLRRFRVGALLAERPEPVPEGCRLVVLQALEARGDETLDEAGAPAAGDAPLRLALTSGTTGTPRAVLHTHDMFERRLERMHFGPVDRPVVIPPALHITLSVFMAVHALCRGGTVVFPRSFATDHFFEAILDQGVTHVAMPPANLAVMMRSLPPSGGPAFPNVRHLRLVATSLSKAVFEAARTRFSPHVYAPYGLTEVGVVSMATPEMLQEQPTTVGRLEPGVEVRFDDGQIGVRVPPMPAGYHGPDAGEGTHFRDGFFWPGDRAHFDGELLFIDGRIDHIINANGRKVAPEYVESILMEFPGIRDAAAYPLDDGAGGTTVAAAVVADPGVDLAALRNFASRRLQLAAPTKYTRVESLPRSAMGKLEREGLAALA